MISSKTTAQCSTHKTMMLQLMVAMCCVATTTLACPYMMRDGRNDSVTGGFTNPHLGRQDSSSARAHRRIQQQSAPAGDRKLILGPIGDLIAAIFNFILSIFGLGRRGDPETVAEAIAFARDDIEDILDDDRAAEMLRLAFHDCTSGICDGCIDENNIDNGGLDDPIDDLEPIVTEFADFLTRGDIWVLASYVALERQQQGGNSVSFDLEFVGRPQCADSANPPQDDLPSAHLNTAGLIAYFDNAFSLTNRETAAIMGAHTLGRAVLDNSGFNGNAGWVNNRNNFDNQFYRTLLDNNVIDPVFVQEEQINTNRPFHDQFLWREGNDNQFMLNADMAVAVDFGNDIDATTGAVTCELSGTTNACASSVLLSDAVDFANNDGQWRQEFHTAFMKMTNIGCSGGVCTPV